jgi:hypothetical protein
LSKSCRSWRDVWPSTRSCSMSRSCECNCPHTFLVPSWSSKIISDSIATTIFESPIRYQNRANLRFDSYDDFRFDRHEFVECSFIILARLMWKVICLVLYLSLHFRFERHEFVRCSPSPTA